LRPASQAATCREQVRSALTTVALARDAGSPVLNVDVVLSLVRLIDCGLDHVVEAGDATTQTTLELKIAIARSRVTTSINEDAQC
jgi:hypothetical protein